MFHAKARSRKKIGLLPSAPWRHLRETSREFDHSSSFPIFLSIIFLSSFPRAHQPPFHPLGVLPMTRLLFAILLAIATCTTARAAEPSALQKEFVAPPAAARPWVYWFWLNSNITKEGITADLEAMQRVGIGGVLIMEVDQGAPQGPVAFAGPQVAGTLQVHAQRGRPAGPGSQHEQRRRLVRQRRALDHARTVDAVGRLDGNQRGRRQAFRGRAARAEADGQLLSRHHRAGLPHAGRQGPHREHQRQDGPRSPGPAAGPGQVCGSAGRPGHQGAIPSSISPPSSRTAA